MDCKALDLENETRCDFLFVSEENGTTWVVPIEFKGGDIGKPKHVANQLRSGAKLAAKLLPKGIQLRFNPVLVYQKTIHRLALKKLRKERVHLRGSNRMIEIIKCGERLVKVQRR